MREFSDFEKYIIRRVVADCDKVGFSISMDIIIQEMEKVNIIAIEWDKTNTYTKFYGIKDHEPLTKVFDIVFLLKYLDENRFIYVHSNNNVQNSLFSIKKYKKVDEFYFRIIDENTFGSDGQMFTEIHTNIGKEIQQVSKGIIYSSFALKDLVHNNFETPEQKHFLEIKKKTNISIGIAIVIGLIGILLNIIALCKETKLDISQLKQIEQTIYKLKIPKVIKTKIINDTLKVLKTPKSLKD